MPSYYHTLRVAFYFARRYFKEKGKKRHGHTPAKGVFVGRNFIRFLTNLSMLGVCIGTAALVVVLSVFNGLEDLTKGMFRRYNPELRIVAAQGKVFPYSEELHAQLRALPDVVAVTGVIEDNALLRYNEEQLVVTVKGVEDNFLQQYDLSDHLVQGEFALYEGNSPRAVLGAGVAYQLSVQINNAMIPLQIWYPKRDRKLSSLNPEAAFYREVILPSGMFSIEQSYDFSHVFVPIAFTEKLLKYEGQRSSLEIKTRSPNRIPAVKRAVEDLLGEGFLVQTAEEQQASVLRAVKIERLFGFITFALILAVASFNVFFSLAMLALEKRLDMQMLFAMGATPRLVRTIFLLEGTIIAFLGGGIGLLAGFLICSAQQHFGLVSLGVASSVVEAYPVKMHGLDFVLSGLTVVGITLLAAFFPARQAARIPKHTTKLTS